MRLRSIALIINRGGDGICTGRNHETKNLTIKLVVKPPLKNLYSETGQGSGGDAAFFMSQNTNSGEAAEGSTSQ